MLRHFPIALVLWAAPLSAGASDEPDFSLITAGGNLLHIHSELSPLAINRIHGWRLRLTTADNIPLTDASIRVAGGMPDHDHGLPTEPEVTGESEPGVYKLEGLRFHMPGRWLLTFDIAIDGATDNASLEFEL